MPESRELTVAGSLLLGEQSSVQQLVDGLGRDQGGERRQVHPDAEHGRKLDGLTGALPQLGGPCQHRVRHALGHPEPGTLREPDHAVAVYQAPDAL
jgi:hypothetical protein